MGHVCVVAASGLLLREPCVCMWLQCGSMDPSLSSLIHSIIVVHIHACSHLSLLAQYVTYVWWSLLKKLMES